ncbi:MAG: hypothetical protein H7144_16120 [Burkholderiales bacterium]|nr:hypothetical protein [Phycisphaerae bacterium]
MSSLIESLESRQHMADFSAAINFQPLNAPRAPKMSIDYGAVYDARRGGLTFGWDADNRANAVDRNAIEISRTQRNDTFIAMQQNGTFTWELAVPAAGTYSVTIVAGDPTQTGDRMAIAAEGDVIIAGMTKPRRRFLEGTSIVTITDGRLTISSPNLSSNNKINWVHIESVEIDSTPPPAATGKLAWKKAATMPIARVEPESAVVDGKFYVFSGYSDANWQGSKRVDRYDIKTNTWQRMADMPIGTTHAGVAVVGKKIWFTGGYTARPGTINKQDVGSTNVIIYDTVTNTWSNGPKLPALRASGGLALVENKLYYFGGEDRSRANRREHWMLDLSNQSAGWQSRASIPEGRTHFGTVVINGAIYAMGGQQDIDAEATFLKTSYRYNPKTDKWNQLANMPLQRSHLSPNTIVRDGKILMFGGEWKFNFELAETLSYDPMTNKFTKLTPLPVERASGAAGLIGDQVVFTGGKKHGWFADTYIGTFS